MWIVCWLFHPIELKPSRRCLFALYRLYFICKKRWLRWETRFLKFCWTVNIIYVLEIRFYNVSACATIAWFYFYRTSTLLTVTLSLWTKVNKSMRFRACLVTEEGDFSCTAKFPNFSINWGSGLLKIPQSTNYYRIVPRFLRSSIKE